MNAPQHVRGVLNRLADMAGVPAAAKASPLPSPLGASYPFAAREVW